MNELAERAMAWLSETYAGMVTLEDPEPLVETDRSALFGCRHAEADEPMLAATICVPKDGNPPFPVANAEPLDEDLNLSAPSAAGLWRWRVNARNCLVATDAALSARPATALPWRAGDEEPGWWDRMLERHFPGAEVSECQTWDEVGQAVMDGGEGTKAAVWLQRQYDGRPLTGHLLYCDYNEDGVVILDGQRGAIAKVTDDEVAKLVVARFHRAQGEDAEELTVPWEGPATDFDEAVEKAELWLKYTYDDECELVDPSPEDELARGWLFAANTKRFRATNDWRDQMLDAAVVVPKDAGEPPFGLPNRDPWGWLEDWNDNAPDLPEPPPSGSAAWFRPTTEQIGTVSNVSVHPHWVFAFEEISTFPAGTRVLVWIRRKDFRGRESVGHLVWAVNEGNGIQIIDPMDPNGQPMMDPNPAELRVIRFEGV